MQATMKCSFSEIKSSEVENDKLKFDIAKNIQVLLVCLFEKTIVFSEKYQVD